MSDLNYPMLYIKRREFGFTQSEVANLLGISHQRYCVKELGKAEFKLKEAQKLSEIYDTPIETLFSESLLKEVK